MPTHPGRGQNTEGEAAEGEAAQSQKRKTRGEQDNCYKTTPNPMRNHHRRSRSANLSQPGGEPQKGRQLHDTERKPQVSQDKLNRHTKEAQQEPTSPPEGGGRRRHSTASTERKFPKRKNRDHQRRWPAAKTPRLVTLGERERRIGRRSKKGNTKSEAQE